MVSKKGGFIVALVVLIVYANSSIVTEYKLPYGSNNLTVKSDLQFVNLGFTWNPYTFDPAFKNNIIPSVIMKNIYEGLVIYNEKNEIIPALASEWTISEYGKTYVFKIKHNLKWSDGSPLTAEDFEFSYFRILDKSLNYPNAPYFTNYIQNALEYYEGKVDMDKVGIKALDINTLKITLKHRTPYFLDILNDACYSPISKQMVIKNPTNWMNDMQEINCSGPLNYRVMKKIKKL